MQRLLICAKNLNLIDGMPFRDPPTLAALSTRRPESRRPFFLIRSVQRRSAIGNDGSVRGLDRFRFAHAEVPDPTRASFGLEQRVVFRTGEYGFPLLGKPNTINPNNPQHFGPMPYRFLEKHAEAGQGPAAFVSMIFWSLIP